MPFDAAGFERITALHNLFDATDPDLTRFAGLGHKLIVWHGWSDPHISPLNSIAYYQAMERTLGKDLVNRFARLYLFPGGYHCARGEGPFDMHLVTPIMQWVELGKAPDKIVASGPAERTRPIYPYPAQAKYRGSGSVDSEASFTRAEGAELNPYRLQWLGSAFYSSGYEVWCMAGPGGAQCSSQRPTSR